MSTEIADLKEGESNCCGSWMWLDAGICGECGDHCENVEPKPQNEFIIKCEKCGCVTDTTEFPEYQKGEINHWKDCPMLLDDEPDNQD